MSIELFVLSDKQLSSMSEWQAAINSEGYPIRLDSERPFDALKGFLPAQLGDTDTGFECGHWAAEEFVRELPNVNFGHRWKYLLTFRWGGDFDQLQAAWMAAAAYAKATNGVVFDDQEGKIRTAAEAREAVGEIERGMPVVEAILRDLNKS